MFVGFNAEEEGLVGSAQMAKKAWLQRGPQTSIGPKIGRNRATIIGPKYAEI